MTIRVHYSQDFCAAQYTFRNVRSLMSCALGLDSHGEFLLFSTITSYTGPNTARWPDLRDNHFFLSRYPMGRLSYAKGKLGNIMQDFLSFSGKTARMKNCRARRDLQRSELSTVHTATEAMQWRG